MQGSPFTHSNGQSQFPDVEALLDLASALVFCVIVASVWAVFPVRA